jgi:hypothetical protein
MKQEYMYQRGNNDLRVVDDEERGLALRRAPAAGD